MAGNVFSVKPGSAQQISGAPLGQNTLIVNLDTANGVWLKSTVDLAPQLGVFLGPAASCTWIGQQLYACVDTGVATTVVLNISNDVSQLDNPVAVAEALAIIGLPNVFLENQIFQGIIAAGAAMTAVNTAQYASLIITPNTVAPTHEVQLLYQFFDVNGLTTDFGTIKWFAGITADALIIPVKGVKFSLFNLDAVNAAPQITIDGTNRLSPFLQPYNSFTFGGVNTYAATGTFTGGTTTALLNQGLTASLYPVMAQGNVFCEFTIPNVTAKGQFRLIDPDGNSISITDTGDTLAGWHTVGAATQTGYKQIWIPNDGVRYQWEYVSNTAPGASITLQVQCLQ